MGERGGEVRSMGYGYGYGYFAVICGGIWEMLFGEEGEGLESLRV